MKNTKKQQVEFYSKCKAILVDLGAKEVKTDRSYNLVIQTSIGGLYLHIDDDNTIMFSVYGNFMDESTKAKEIFGHWKQNVHTTECVNETLEEVKYFYSRILKKVRL